MYLWEREGNRGNKKEEVERGYFKYSKKRKVYEYEKEKEIDNGDRKEKNEGSMYVCMHRVRNKTNDRDGDREIERREEAGAK